MSIKEELLIQYAHARIRWLMSMAKHVWSMTLSIAGFSFLAGYHLSQDESLVSVIHFLLAIALIFSVFNLILLLRKDRDEGEPELFKAALEAIAKEVDR